MTSYVAARRLHAAQRLPSAEKGGQVQDWDGWRILVALALVGVLVGVLVGAFMGALARPSRSQPLTPQDAILPVLVYAM
jgi:hypothetical protein